MIENTSKIAIIFSVIGIFVLYVISLLSSPPLIQFNDVQSYDGCVVSVKGFVEDVRITRSGNAILTLINSTDTLKIFVTGGGSGGSGGGRSSGSDSGYSSVSSDGRSGNGSGGGECGKCEEEGGIFDLKIGDEVEVEGRVQFNSINSDVCIFTTPERIRRINESECGIYSVSQVAHRPLKFVGRRICVSGYVCRSYKRVFYLCDDRSFGTLRVVCQENRSVFKPSTLAEGNRVIVRGVLRYNPKIMRYEFIGT